MFNPIPRFLAQRSVCIPAGNNRAVVTPLIGAFRPYGVRKRVVLSFSSCSLNEKKKKFPYQSSNNTFNKKEGVKIL